MTAQDERLLEFYETELRYLRNAGADFARRYPKLAGRLELSSNGSADPQVERLLESFAYLAARLHRRLEDDISVVPSALLQSLYPLLANPTPATAIASFATGAEVPPPPSGQSVARGSLLYAQSEQGSHCRFQTAYPVDLWPLRLSALGEGQRGDKDRFDRTRVDSVLRLRLTGHGAKLNDVTAGSLRLFLSGPRKHAAKIQELLMADLLDIALVGAESGEAVHIGAEALSPVGFAAEHALLPDETETHPAFRLLKEYFTLPEKFLFLDLKNLDHRPAGGAVDILFALKRRPPDWLDLAAVRPRLGCTPVVNLFRKTVEPMALNHRETAYRVVPEIGADDSYEVHSIERVEVTAPGERRPRPVAPFFGQGLSADGESAPEILWVSRREMARGGRSGSDTFLSFVEPDLQPVRPARETATIHTLCTNRTLAGQLNAGAELFGDFDVPARIMLLDRPTTPSDAVHGAPAMWQLVSQMSLNHLAFHDEDGQGRHVEMLREMLRLYCPEHRPEAAREVMGIADLSAEVVVRRVGQDVWRGFCEGIEITLVLDEGNFAETSAYLFASVLRHVFSLYAAVNTFTELVLVSRQREGTWMRWPPLIGGQDLI